MEELVKLFSEKFGSVPESIDPLPASGSPRHYYRLRSGDNTIIGATGPSNEENKAFVTLACHLRNNGINVPAIFSAAPDYSCYLQEDLGNDSLYDLVSHGRSSGQYSPSEKELLLKTIRALPKIQCEGAVGLDWNCCYPQREFDRRMIEFDLNYFKYCFLKLTGIDFHELRLDDDFKLLSNKLLEAVSDNFMYRDFQARNVMIRDGEPWFIDFQGGRKGPLHYDLASFVWQARASYGDELKAELVDAYLDELSEYCQVDRKEFLSTLRLFVLFRTLQVLGAYGFRGLIEHKQHFVESIPYAMDNLRELLREPFEEFPYLDGLLRKLSELTQFAALATPRATGNADSSNRLTVTVFSFSYRKGIPQDESGNGGGFVFDCRALANPGKYERYRQFNGRDAEVIKFIEDDGGVFPFLENAYSMCDAHVKRFLERGFTNMMISFGCTGGQHRSVYCAEHAAHHIASRFNVAVHLIHREMGIDETFDGGVSK